MSKTSDCVTLLNNCCCCGLVSKRDIIFFFTLYFLTSPSPTSLRQVMANVLYPLKGIQFEGNRAGVLCFAFFATNFWQILLCLASTLQKKSKGGIEINGNRLGRQGKWKRKAFSATKIVWKCLWLSEAEKTCCCCRIYQIFVVNTDTYVHTNKSALRY